MWTCLTWERKVATDDDEMRPLTDEELAPPESFFRKWRFLGSVALGALVMFSAGAYFLLNGVNGMLDSKEDVVFVEGMRALEENDLDTATNRFMTMLSKHQDDALVADYLAWVEARKGNFERSLYYARISISIPESYGSYELMGYLALLGYGKAVGAPAALYYFGEYIKTLPKDERADAMRQMLLRGLRLAQTRQDFVDLVNESTRWKLPRGMLVRGDLYFKGHGETLSPKSAIMFWNDALKAGDFKAINRLAITKWYGYGTDRDLPQAIELFQDAVSKGDPVACYNLGLIRLRNDDPQVSDNGYALIKRSASLHYGPAITATAILSLNLHADPESVEESYQLLAEATKRGDISGSILYAFMTYGGIGCQRPMVDKARAIFYELKRRHIGAVDGIYDYLTFAAMHEDAEVLDAFNQIITLCASQLYGELSFDDGDPFGQAYIMRNMNSNLTPYYKPTCKDPSLTEVEQKLMGRNYVCKFANAYNLKIRGRRLYSSEFTRILTHYNPTTDIEDFSPNVIDRITLPAPKLPDRFGRYNIDFVRINAWAEVPGYEIWFIKP